MDKYLKMADVFPSEMRVGGDSDNLIIDDVGIIIGCYSGAKMAEHVLHAINSHDELVAEVERLRVVVDGVIAASKSMQDRKPLTPWGDGFKECAVSIERAIRGVMSGELSVFPRDL